jgi:putative membrane protein
VLTRLVILDGIHLKQCVTLYLFSLPFTMVKDLGWATVPIVTLVSFTFMGIEGIAEQIEMPFGDYVYLRNTVDPNLLISRRPR